jgi:AcrR family transcriptional regulator
MATDMNEAERAEVAVAVRKALSEHGYERLTTSKIAKEYGKSEAGLYYYFDSKEEMIVAFLEHSAVHLKEDLLSVDTSDPEAALREACSYLFLSPDDSLAGVAVAIMELLSHAPYNETLREPLEDLETAILESLADIIAAGVDQAVFRPVDPRATATFLLAAADGSTGFYLALEMDVDEDLQAGLSAYIDSLLVDSP